MNKKELKKEKDSKKYDGGGNNDIKLPYNK